MRNQRNRLPSIAAAFCEWLASICFCEHAGILGYPRAAMYNGATLQYILMCLIKVDGAGIGAGRDAISRQGCQSMKDISKVLSLTLQQTTGRRLAL